MSLRFFHGGRLLSLTEIVDLLDDQEDKGLGLAGVFGHFWRQGLIAPTDRFKYMVETTTSHIYQRVEVWGNKYGRGHAHYSDGWFQVLVLKHTSENKVPVISANVKGVQGETPLSKAGLRSVSDEQRGPPDPCPQCDLTWRCLHGCKRGSFT